MTADFLARMVLEHSVKDWLLLAGTWMGVALILFVAKRLAVRSVRKVSKMTATRADDILLDVIEGLRPLFLAAVALYLALESNGFDLPWALKALYLAGLLQATLSLSDLGRLVADWYMEAQGEDASLQTAVTAILLLGRILLWLIFVTLAIQAFGVDISALVTGLGIGGIAVALAVQNVLQDLLAYVSILFDRPFVQGDFLIVGEMVGTVEHIGIKSTRLRSLSGEELVFSNADLLSSRLKNFKTLGERRIVFQVGVLYDTPHDVLEGIPATLKAAVEAQEPVRFDRAHLKGFGDSSVNFEVVYYVLLPDYVTYMDIQQSINLYIFKAFGEAGIGFAFPTRTLHVASVPAGLLGSGAASAASAE